jgi:hypothetical protein
VSLELCSPEAPEGLQMYQKRYESTGRDTEAPKEIQMHWNKESLYYYASVYIYSCFASYKTASLSFSAIADNTQQHTLFILQHKSITVPLIAIVI